MIRIIYAVALFCGSVQVITCANILAFYPIPAISHQRVYWPLLRELAVRGHNVTTVSPFKMHSPPANNYNEIKVVDYTDQCRAISSGIGIEDASIIRRFAVRRNILNVMPRELGQYLTEKILQDPAVQWLITTDMKFDVILGEFSFCQEAYSVFIHKFQAPYVEVTSFGNFHWSYWLYGNPLDTSYIGDEIIPYSDSMTFFQRLDNTVYSLVHRLIWYYYYLPKQQLLADTFLKYPGWKDRSPIAQSLSENTSLLLINTHFSLNYPYPLAPHVKEIGGINIQGLDAPASKDVQDFMDGAKDGLIYFSMGSYLVTSSTFDNSTRDAFFQVFSKLKQRVLIKWEKSIPKLPPNIKIGKWLPQTTILDHPNCKLFISHCGFLSLSEAIYSGVPMLAIPVFADQPRNALVASRKGLSITLSMMNLTRGSISWAVNELIKNPMYKEKAMEQSKIYRDKPETALETAVYWIEYVIRHKGAAHLRPAIATMPWYQQAMIDVYLTITAIILIHIYTIYKLIIIIYKCLLCKLFSKKKKIE